MKGFFSKRKGYGVLVCFALSAIVVIAVLCTHGYGKKKREHLAQGTQGEAKRHLHFTRSA